MMEPGWILYLGVFFGPFVQEDAAVLAAATLSSSNSDHFPTIFFVILFGLFLSDMWKYWIGYTAHASSRARAFAEREHVQDFSDKVGRNLFVTLLTARFLPLARIPAYVACGYFKVNYLKFCALIFSTGLLYCVLIFALVHSLGEIFGEQMEIVIAILGVTLIAILVLTVWIRKLVKSRREPVFEPGEDSDQHVP